LIALLIDPTRPDVHNIIGLLLAERGDVAAAEAEYREALAFARISASPNQSAKLLQAHGR